MVESQVRGEFALMRLMMQVRGFAVAGSVKLSPKRIFVISTVSCARSGWVTEPMYGLSLYFMWLYTMSKCRLLTGRSTGSQMVPPEGCRGLAGEAGFTKLRKSSMVA